MSDSSFILGSSTSHQLNNKSSNHGRHSRGIPVQDHRPSDMIRNSAKALLRERVKKTIKEITPESRAHQSKVILEKILLLPSFNTAKRVSVYLSTGDEVNTLPIVEELFRRDKQVYVPTYNGADMEMVRLHSMSDYESLPLTKWKIKQPDFSEEGRENALKTGGLDLVLLPGVAFSKQCGRCGHGMGYYDKFLKRLFATISRDKVTLVGLGFNEQMVDESCLPLDPHDVLLDQVITGV